MDKETKKEFENLAVIIKRGFDFVDKRFEQADKRFDQMDERFNHVESRLSLIEHDVADIRANMVYRDEFDDLSVRVKYTEKKLGIKSGK